MLDEHALIHKFSKKELSLKKKPWINRSIQSLMRERDKPFESYCQETNPTVKLTKHNDYKRIRNIVVCKIKESKKYYYQNYFQRNTKKLKKTWDGIKSVVTLKSKANTSPNSLFVDRNIIADKTSIAKTFNNFFVNVGSNLESKIPKAKNPFDKYLKKRISNSFFINPVKDTEIEKLIKNLNQNKSLGPCSIPVKILKIYANDLKQPLAFLINLSFQQGVFPEALKTARVTSIFKKDNSEIPSKWQAPKFRTLAITISRYRNLNLAVMIAKIIQKILVVAKK